MPDVSRRSWATPVARRLRADMTEPEVRLWFALRHDFPWKFRRQEPIGPFVCDFVCYAKRLVVEVDGAHHGESATDAIRDAYLRSQGFAVLRVWNDEVMTDLAVVLEQVSAAIDSLPDLHRNRRPRARRR